MPEQSYPPYVAGAAIQPRQLNRWLDVNAQNGALARTQSYITLPSFSTAVTWIGYSEIVAAFNYEGPNNFSLKSVPVVVAPNYTLCIMWREGTTTHRYSIHRAVGDVLYFDITPYTGQLIKKSFRFEIWSTNATPAVHGSALTFYTSVRGKIDYRHGDDFVLVSSTGLVTDFSQDNPYQVPTAARLHLVSNNFTGPNWPSDAYGTSSVSSVDASKAIIANTGYRGVSSTNLILEDATTASWYVADLHMIVYITGTGQLLNIPGQFLLTVNLSAGVYYLTVNGIFLAPLNGLNRVYYIAREVPGYAPNTVVVMDNTGYVASAVGGFVPFAAPQKVNLLGGVSNTNSIIEMSVSPFTTSGNTNHAYYLYKYFSFTLPLTFPNNSVPTTN